MTRHIDFSKPLTEDEIQYVHERPWLLQDARMRGEDIITEESFSVDSDVEDDTETEIETEADEADDETEVETEEAESEEDEVAPYDEWEYAALKDEAGHRGLSKSGSKEQLIERLTTNDAETSEESE